MGVLRRGAALLLLSAAAGCGGFLRDNSPVEVSADQPLVHGVLVAGSDTVAVLVTRLRTQNGRTKTLPISGAGVRIAGGGAEAELREAPAGFPACVFKGYPGEPSPPDASGAEAGCYAAVLPGGVRAGERYTLEVDLPMGGTARGETTVPHAPTLLRPGEGARLVARQQTESNFADSDSVRVVWTSPEPGVRVALRTVASDVYLADGTVPDARCAVYLVDRNSAVVDAPEATDSIAGRVTIAGCQQRTGPTSVQPLRPDSVAVDFVLAAFDSTYSRYAEAHLNDIVRERRASAGITGAYGVFGSAATTRRRVLFVIEER